MFILLEMLDFAKNLALWLSFTMCVLGGGVDRNRGNFFFDDSQK